MSEQHSEFIHALLGYKLQERLYAALSTINSLSKEDVFLILGAGIQGVHEEYIAVALASAEVFGVEDMAI